MVESFCFKQNKVFFLETIQHNLKLIITDEPILQSSNKKLLTNVPALKETFADKCKCIYKITIALSNKQLIMIKNLKPKSSNFNLIKTIRLD